MDLFERKELSPMLIAQMQEPFSDEDWIYELKLDGCRCLGYFDDGKVWLRNKRNLELLPSSRSWKGPEAGWMGKGSWTGSWWC